MLLTNQFCNTYVNLFACQKDLILQLEKKLETA